MAHKEGLLYAKAHKEESLYAKFTPRHVWAYVVRQSTPNIVCAKNWRTFGDLVRQITPLLSGLFLAHMKGAPKGDSLGCLPLDVLHFRLLLLYLPALSSAAATLSSHSDLSFSFTSSMSLQLLLASQRLDSVRT